MIIAAPAWQFGSPSYTEAILPAVRQMTQLRISITTHSITIITTNFN